MKSLFRSNGVTVLVLFLTAAVVSAVVYPEIFMAFKTNFRLWPDYGAESAETFVLTSFFYQGGVQLWNYYGQQPFFHTYAVLGLFSFPKMITALAYYVSAPFSDDSSRFFNHVFAWVYLMTLLFLRVAGIFLLLKTVTKNRYILTIATVIFSVFFCQMAFLGGLFWRSYFPLGMYFVVRFFQEFKWRQLAAIVLFFTICMGSGVLMGAYIYLPMHFFIVSGILWKIFFAPRPWNLNDNRRTDTRLGLKAAGVILLAVLIMAPYLYIYKFGFPDLAFDQASRLSHTFSPWWYFHKLKITLGDPGAYISYNLDFQTRRSYYWFEGWSFLFLALTGLVLSRNRLKYFFAFGLLFLWLLTFPREGINIGLVAHWINAWTNPLKTMVRDYQADGQPMVPYLLMPLAVMGIEALYELYRGKKYSGLELGMLGSLTLLFTAASIPYLFTETKIYLIICTTLVIAGLSWVHFRGSLRAKSFLLGTLCFLVLTDVFFIIHQSKELLADFERKPAVFDASPQSGMVDSEFENPSIFPYRYSYLFHFSYRDEAYLWFPHAISSDVHHVINQALNYTYLSGYNPRHVEFVEWLHDPAMLKYLEQNYEFIFLARAAIQASPGALGRICNAGLARQVVEVDDPSHYLNLPDHWPPGITNKESDFQYSQMADSLADTQDSSYHPQGDMMIYRWDLPSNFPDHLASSWFEPEQRYLRFLVEQKTGQWQELTATQGELIRPYTFDVQNIKQGSLVAAFPKYDFPINSKCVLLYPSSGNQGVEKLWRKQSDNLGIIYRAKQDGWLVGHYPYDTKWRIFVDDKPVDYYRVNETFIGFPLTAGEHKILIQYWPYSSLRALLLFSAIAITLGLPGLIFTALRWEQIDPQKSF